MSRQFKKKNLDENSRVGKNDSCPTCVLYREFRFPIFSSDTAYCSRQVVPMECLDVFNFKRVKVQVV